MKTKILSLFLLTAILTIAIVSASVDFTITPSTITFTDTDLSETFTIKNTGNETADITIPAIKINNVDVVLDSTSFQLAPAANKTIIATVTSNEMDEVIGTYSKTITITSKNTTEEITYTQSLTVEINGGDYCEVGTVGDLEVDRVKFDNLGLGKDDEWYLTDEIEVEVRVENLDNVDDIDDVIVEWGLYNTKTGDFVIDDEEDDFDIKDGDKETITFLFTLDPDDFDEDDNEGDFVFLVKAYSDDLGEDVACDWHQEDMTLNRDKHYVILDDITFLSEIVPCGEELEINTEVWNIGDNDEEDVYVLVYNQQLEINERIDVGDLDVLDSKKISFSFKIPKDATEKFYDLELIVFDEDRDIFENDDDDESRFLEVFKIEGNCKSSEEVAGVQITAELDSETPEAIAGKQVIVKSTIKNTGTDTTTYSISVFGNSAWSSLSAIDPQVITLDAGESKDVSIFLDVDEDAEAEQEFTIKATYGEQTTEQKVTLVIEKGVTQDVVVGHLKENWFIYVIALINIILIIAIIAVVKSMVGRAPAAR